MESFVMALALVVAASGENTQPRETDQYPYIVSIHRNAKSRSFLCAGSLIASTWVLTTANCLPKFACKIRYGDMLAFESATYSRIRKRIHHINSRSIYTAVTQKNRLTPKTNNIGLAHIDEVLNTTFGLLSGVDYSAMLGRQVTVFEFSFMPSFKSKIYEMNRNRLGKYDRLKKKKFLFARFEGDNQDKFIPTDTNVLRTTIGIAVLCQMKHFAGPNICVANKCFDFDADSDPRSTMPTPDYGAPLIHGDTIVGVTSEVEAHFSRHTPVSPYVDWISQQMNLFTPKECRRTF